MGSILFFYIMFRNPNRIQVFLTFIRHHAEMLIDIIHTLSSFIVIQKEVPAPLVFDLSWQAALNMRRLCLVIESPRGDSVVCCKLSSIVILPIWALKWSSWIKLIGFFITEYFFKQVRLNCLASGCQSPFEAASRPLNINSPLDSQHNASLLPSLASYGWHEKRS